MPAHPTVQKTSVTQTPAVAQEEPQPTEKPKLTAPATITEGHRKDCRGWPTGRHHTYLNGQPMPVILTVRISFSLTNRQQLQIAVPDTKGFCNFRVFCG